MDSIGDTEEVETDSDEDSEDEDLDQDEDTEDDKSKKSKKAAKGAEVDDDEESEEDDTDEEDENEIVDEGKKPKSGTYKPRLKQFFNDDGKLDSEKLETAYIESSKQGVKLNEDLEKEREKYTRLVDAIKAKPEAAKILLGEEGAKNLAKEGDLEDKQTLDPYARHIKAQLDKANKKEYNDFIDAHPEAATDPEKIQKIGKFLKRYAVEYAEDNDGELPTMKNAFEAAYRYYDWSLGTTKEEDLAIAAKKNGSTRHTPNKKHPVKKQKKSDMTEFFANKMNVKLK